MMKKRIFLAIKISDKFKKEILKFRQQYKNLPVRWMRDENLHLTLIPPMQLNDNEIVEMIKKLQTLKGKIGQIEIKFSHVSLGPNPRRPRLIWAESKQNQKLVELKNKITQILGLQAESRPFRPHLTLARFKLRDYFNFSIKNLSEKIGWLSVAESIWIIQSECLPEGARYTVLGKVRL